jgi:carboxylate-amine ligase
VPDSFWSWAEYDRFVRFLLDTRSISEHTEIWWSVRPHQAFGTVEIRICDGLPDAGQAIAVAAFQLALVAHFAARYDAGEPLPDPPGRDIEENLWRALRYGLDGRMVDLDRGQQFSAAAIGDRLLAWTAPARAALGLEPALPEENATQRQRRALAEGATIREAFGAEVELTERTYATEEVTT